MSWKALSSSDGSGRRLRCHETPLPLRRSPRLLSKKKEEPIGTTDPNSKKKTMNRSSKKTHLRSPPIPSKLGFSPKCLKDPSRPNKTQQGPLTSIKPVDGTQPKRRSLRLPLTSPEASKDEHVGSIDPNSQKKSKDSSTEKAHLRSANYDQISSFDMTHRGYSMKCLKETWRPIETLQGHLIQPRRRSMRLAVNSANAAKQGAVSLHQEEMASRRKKTRKGYSSEILTSAQKEIILRSQRKHAESISKVDGSQTPRRSLRLAANSSRIAIKRFGLDAFADQGMVREERPPPTLAKVSRKAELGINPMDDAMGSRKRGRRKYCSHAITDITKGVDKKRRKIEKGESDGLTDCMIVNQMSCGRKVGIGRTEVEEKCGFDSWTEDEEEALRRAYFVARPSPHFWKKVSKMVPGKTPQECFDRVQGNFETPPQPRPRPKKNNMNSSPIANLDLSLSTFGRLTKTGARVERLRSSKRGGLATLKITRHLMRKHRAIDQTNEPDHFSVFETSPNALMFDLPDITPLGTRHPLSNHHGPIQRCSEISLSGSKPISRLKCLSPQVLKKVKNTTLHEKYLNILHCRESRRTFAKTSSSLVARENTSGSELKTRVRAARSALMSEARDVISNFQHMQANIQESDTEDDDVDDVSEEE